MRFLGLLAITIVAVSAAVGDAVTVENERLAVDPKTCQARLRCGLFMVPGSERIEAQRRTRVSFTRVASDPQPGQYTITPTGVITFHRSDRKARLFASYSYVPRTVAVLPVDSGSAPQEIASAVRSEAEKLLEYRGCRIVPDAQVDRAMQLRRLYPTSDFAAEVVRELGSALRAQDIVVVRVEDWDMTGGKSLIGYLWTGPFGGSRKRVSVALHARLYSVETGRLLWEGRSRAERYGGKLGGVPASLRNAAVSGAVIDLFDNYLSP
ncbi:MAG: hypothetical protein ACUVTZ_06070 [Armatimonadota bacterium]